MNTLTINNLTPGDSYKVQIRSRYYNADRSVHESSGPWTATATQRVKNHPPAAPTGLTASLVEHNSLTLTWNDPQDTNITGYRIQRGTDAGSLSTIAANTGSAGTEYTDSTVAAKTTYHYAVLALSQDGNGPQSAAVSVTTPAEPESKNDHDDNDGTRNPDSQDANNAPTASNHTVNTNEDTYHAFAATDFNYSDSDGDTLASVKITELPATGNGELKLNSTAITANNLPKTVTEAELDDGKLQYAPPANANGAAYASFKFRVNDGSGDSVAEYTMTIDVRAVNDPATGVPTITGEPQVGEILTASTSDITDVDRLPNVFSYQWRRFSADGTEFDANIGTNSATYILTDDEFGARVKVEVTFADREYNLEGPLVSAIFPSSGTVEEEILIAEQQRDLPPQTDVSLPRNTLLSNINQPSSDTMTLNASSQHHGVTTSMVIDAPHGMNISDLQVRVFDWDSSDGMHARIYAGPGEPWKKFDVDPLVRYRSAIVRNGVARFVVDGESRINPSQTRPGRSGVSPVPYIVVLTRTAGEFGVGLTSSSANDSYPNGKDNSQWKFAETGEKAQLLLTGAERIPDPIPGGRGEDITTFVCPTHTHTADELVENPHEPHDCARLLQPTEEPPYSYDGTLSLGREKRYSFTERGATGHLDPQADPVINLDNATFRIALTPGTKYRLTVRGENAGGGTVQQYHAYMSEQAVACVSIYGCPDHGDANGVSLNEILTYAPLVHFDTLTELSQRQFDNRQFFIDFQTPCELSNANCRGPSVKYDYEYPQYYYVVVDPTPGVEEGDTVSIKVERLSSSAELIPSPDDDQHGYSGDTLDLANDGTISGQLDYRTDYDRHDLGESHKWHSCRITPTSHGIDPASNLRIRGPGISSGRTYIRVDDLTEDHVFVYSSSGDTGGYQLTVSQCVTNIPPAQNREDDVEDGAPVEMRLGSGYTKALNHDRDSDLFVIQLSGRGGDPFEEGKWYQATLQPVRATFNSPTRGRVTYQPAQNIHLSLVQTNDCLHEKISDYTELPSDYAEPLSVQFDDNSQVSRAFTPFKLIRQQVYDFDSNAYIWEELSYTRPEEKNQPGTQCYLLRVSSGAGGSATPEEKIGGYRITVRDEGAIPHPARADAHSPLMYDAEDLRLLKSDNTAGMSVFITRETYTDGDGVTYPPSSSFGSIPGTGRMDSYDDVDLFRKQVSPGLYEVFIQSQGVRSRSYQEDKSSDSSRLKDARDRARRNTLRAGFSVLEGPQGEAAGYAEDLTPGDDSSYDSLANPGGAICTVVRQESYVDVNTSERKTRPTYECKATTIATFEAEYRDYYYVKIFSQYNRLNQGTYRVDMRAVQAPSLSGLANASEATSRVAKARATVRNPRQTPVYAQYRKQGEPDWIDLTSRKTSSSFDDILKPNLDVEFTIPSPDPSVVYNIRASLTEDFSSGVRTLNIRTAPDPAVSRVRERNLTHNSADVTVSLTNGRVGDYVKIWRKKTADLDSVTWEKQTLRLSASNLNTAVFHITGLDASTSYDVRVVASPSTIADALPDVYSSSTFSTGADPN